MREITPGQILAFMLMFVAILLIAFLLTCGVGSVIPPGGDFRGVFLVACFVVLMYASAFAVYRLFLRWKPLSEGDIPQGSPADFSAQVNILFYLILFNSLIRTHFLPVPLLRVIYLALGAKLGRNTYSAGVILDPPLIVAGSNCIIGHDAVIFSHAIEGADFSLATVRLGDNVTIGATAVVMSGVHIESGAIVSAGAVVLKGTKIGRDEIWGGVPARLIGRRGGAEGSAQPGP